MNGLFYLAYLVKTKNELNRARRRFYYRTYDHFRWTNTHVPFTDNWGGRSWFPTKDQVKVKPRVKMSKKVARAGYKKLQLAMKSMTPEMRRIREEIGARLVWGDSGNIQAIQLENKYYGYTEIERLAECHLADSILLGDT